jgi:hypothetical protein
VDEEGQLEKRLRDDRTEVEVGEEFFGRKGHPPEEKNLGHATESVESSIIRMSRYLIKLCLRLAENIEAENKVVVI